MFTKIVNDRLGEILKVIIKLNALIMSNENKDILNNLKIEKAVKYLLKTRHDLMYIKSKDGKTQVR